MHSDGGERVGGEASRRFAKVRVPAVRSRRVSPGRDSAKESATAPVRFIDILDVPKVMYDSCYNSPPLKKGVCHHNLVQFGGYLASILILAPRYDRRYRRSLST